MSYKYLLNNIRNRVSFVVCRLSKGFGHVDRVHLMRSNPKHLPRRSRCEPFQFKDFSNKIFARVAVDVSQVNPMFNLAVDLITRIATGVAVSNGPSVTSDKCSLAPFDFALG